MSSLVSLKALLKGFIQVHTSKDEVTQSLIVEGGKCKCTTTTKPAQLHLTSLIIIKGLCILKIV